MPVQLEKYYGYLKQNGADVPDNFNSFKTTLSDEKNAGQYYNYLKENKFDVPETFDSFSNTFGLKKKAGGVVSSPTEYQFPSLDTKLFGEAAIKPVSESTNLGNADIVNKTKMIESLPIVKDKAIHDKTIKNLLQQGKLAMEGSNSYNEEKQKVSNTLRDEEWMPSGILPVEKDYLKNKAIKSFSENNNENTKSIENKINSGEYILENGKVKIRGGIADNFGQGIKDFVDNIGLSLNVSAAQSRGNNNEIKYYMNEFYKNKDKDKEFAAVSLPEKASKTIGEMSPYAIAGAIMPYADIPLMGLSNLSSNHQAIWNDDKMTMDEKANAINNTTKDAFMTGNLQGAAFNAIGISDEKAAKDLLKRYEPTQKLYNNFKDVIKTLPSDVTKAAAIGGGTEVLNDLTKNKEGVKVDFGSIPEGALSMATLELIMKAPKVFASGFKTLNEAVRTGYDKENPNWYNRYSKNVQDVLNQIVSSPEPVYNKLVNLLDVHPDAESELAKQKIETFRDYYKSLPSDLDISQKNKALHILQLKTEAMADAQNAQDITIKKSLENKASVYDKILQRVINKEPVDENQEPLLLSRFAAPIKEEKIEVKPTEVKEEPLKENEYYHATENTKILAPSDKGYKKREGANVVGEGIYFGKDKEHLTDRYGKNAIKAELDIKNPLISNNKYIIVDGREIDVQSLSKEDINFLKQKGYDAIKYEAADRAYSNFDETIVFDKNKIKVKEEVKPTEEQLKTKENVIQEPSTREVLQRPQEGVGETGGERPRVEPSIQGVEIAKEGEQAKINEEKGLTTKGLKSAETRRINEEANKIEPTDSRSAVLKYLSGGNLSQDAINEIAGSVKRAELNTGRREFKTQEVKLRDYVAKKGEGKSLDEAAHSIWDNMSEEMQSKNTTQDVKEALMQAVLEHTTKSEAAKALIEGYKEESVEELERKHYEKYGDNAEKEADNQFNDAPQEDLDIDKELINANYETEQQFQDAYWDAHQATYNAPEKAPSIEAKKPAITEEEKPVEKVNEFLHTGTEEERQKGLLKNLISSGIPEDYKKGLEENGLTYKVSNQVEASDAAKAIIQSLGVTDALDIARGEKIDPSVGSAIYAESLNNLWSNERRLKADGKIEEANALGKQWSDITMEYANKLNSKGKWTAQTAYFYKTSPMGFAIRIENERVEQFQTWYENKEKDYKKVFTEILKSEEGQALLKEEVEKISKEERAKTRADKRQKIDDFFENAKLKGNNLYAIPIPTQVINGALEVMKKAVLAGESVTNAVSMAVEHISKEVKDWDKEKFRKEYEEKLNKVTNDRDNEKLLIKKIAELKRRLEEKDFSAEEYKTKRTLSEKEQAAKDEYDKVKKLYDEAKKESPEYIDKKAKQYLDKLRQRLRGIDEAKKEEIIRRSIKEIVKSGGLEYEDFKNIVSETIGIKKLTDEQKSQIESLTEQSNIADDLEQKFLDNPTRESIDAFRKAKANSLEADRKLFEMTSQKADIVGTLKSLITLNYLGASTLVKNYAQNVIYQASVRFPTSLAKRGIDQSVYGATYMGNKMFGTKVIKPSISLTDAQRGYFNEYRDGVIRGWDQMIKGVDEKDYFSTNQYASSLNPRKSFNDLKAAMKGELFLSKGQKIDKFIQATLGWQPYAISRGMIYGDKPPRYAAQGAEALQIARKELGITDPFETEAFMLSPEKYAYNHLTKKAGLSSEDANKEAKSISKRIVDAGSVATFQNENMFNNLLSKIDEWATVKKDDQWTSKVVKPPVALLKATTIPFLKTPANIYWAYFKLANPALTMTKSLVEVGLAQHALKKGDLIGYREFNKKSKESFGTAMIGLAITAAAASFAAKGLIRTSVQEEDKAREKAGEGFFGKSNELNLGALKGGDDYWVDLSWFGPIGTIMDVRGRMMEDNKQKELRGEKVDNGVMNEIVSTMGYSVSSTLNTLIFDQGAKMVDAIRKGWSGGLNQVAVNNANALGNVVLGATIPAINKALAPEKADLAADNVLDQIANNQKQRNVFVTWAKGYPPSKVSIWGEPISQDRTVSGVLGAMLGFEKGSADKFGAILYNEQRRTGKNEFFPPVEDKKIKVNGNDVKITVEEKRDLDTYIGQARKTMVSPFINDKSIYTVFLRKGEEVADFTYSELTAGKNKAGQIISQEEADRVKLAALDIIYENGKKAGFSKFKEKYIQYQDATLNVEKLQKQALESAEKTIFKAKIEQPPQ
jgi:hypothetical protein